MISGKPAFLICFIILQFFVALYAAQLPRVELKTTKGTIVLELYEKRAPKTVRNFLNYVKNGFYDDLIFHRVVNGRIIQAGGYDKDLVEYETNKPIRNEAANGLKNMRGTVAMARTSDPHSAESQFFINLSDNPALDHKARTMRDYGYCVFAHVVKGMDVSDAIGGVETHDTGGFSDVPVEPVIMERVQLLTE
ncbi:MAG: peptidylprolyl isomerase [Gammaproteobacteria bacterium]